MTEPNNLVNLAHTVLNCEATSLKAEIRSSRNHFFNHMNEANGACNNLKKSHFNSRLGSMGTRVLANELLGSNPVLIQDPFSEGGGGILPLLIYIDN